MADKSSIDYWADWLVDAVAVATQNRMFLRGSDGEDTVATEALLANGKKAMENLLRHRYGDPSKGDPITATQVENRRRDFK
jgi:hypothetical protein